LPVNVTGGSHIYKRYRIRAKFYYRRDFSEASYKEMTPLKNE